MNLGHLSSNSHLLYKTTSVANNRHLFVMIDVIKRGDYFQVCNPLKLLREVCPLTCRPCSALSCRKIQPSKQASRMLLLPHESNGSLQVHFAKYWEQRKHYLKDLFLTDIFEPTCIFAIERVQIFFFDYSLWGVGWSVNGDGYQVYGQGKIQCSNTLRMDLPKLHT